MHEFCLSSATFYCVKFKYLTNDKQVIMFFINLSINTYVFSIYCTKIGKGVYYVPFRGKDISKCENFLETLRIKPAANNFTHRGCTSPRQTIINSDRGCTSFKKKTSITPISIPVTDTEMTITV